MPRPRHIFRGLLVLILLACITLWIRSHWRVEAVGWSDSRHFVDLISSGGRVNLTHTVWDHGMAWKGGWSFASQSRRLHPPHWETTKNNCGRRRFAGFESTDALWPMSDSKTMVGFHVPTYRLIAVPYWALTLLLAFPFLMQACGMLRRRHRIHLNLCATCGYDLRASPHCCPECGTPTAS